MTMTRETKGQIAAGAGLLAALVLAFVLLSKCSSSDAVLDDPFDYQSDPNTQE